MHHLTKTVDLGIELKHGCTIFVIESIKI